MRKSCFKLPTNLVVAVMILAVGMYVLLPLHGSSTNLSGHLQEVNLAVNSNSKLTTTAATPVVVLTVVVIGALVSLASTCHAQMMADMNVDGISEKEYLFELLP